MNPLKLDELAEQLDCLFDEWYAYKKAKLIEIAKTWCEVNQIPYINA